MDRIVCVAGPTASGKTALAVELAKRFGGEVISCDSMQVYRFMNVGTAKPTAEEMQGIPHHMLDVADPWEDYSAARYVEEADAVLRDVLARGKTAIVAGGTGLYMDSLIAGRSFAPAPSTGKREELKQTVREQGIEAVLEFLRTVDPERAEKLNLRDEKRILRAAEIYLETGKTATEHDAETRAIPPRYSPVWLGLNYERRQDLYDRINLRVDKMLENGLERELDELLSMGVDERCTALQAIGYKELLAFRRGELSREEAVEAIKMGSRRYAKRQLSWFRRNEAIRWLELPAQPDLNEMTRRASELVEEAFSAQ